MTLVLNLSNEIVAVDHAVGKTLEFDANSLVGQPFGSACLAAEAAQPVRDAFEAGDFDGLAQLSPLPWRVRHGPPKRFDAVLGWVGTTLKLTGRAVGGLSAWAS